MTTNQIYRLDDVLLRTAVIALGVLAVLVLALAPWEGGLPPASLLWLSLAAFAPVAMFIAGFSVRQREKRVAAVWRLLQRSLELDVPALLRSSTFTRQELRTAVRVLNDRGLGHYVWDDETDVIRDGRLDVRMAHGATCDNCGAAIAVTVGLADAPACPFCETPLPAATLNAMKFDRITRLSTPAPGSAATPAAAAADSANWANLAPSRNDDDHVAALPPPRRRMSVGLFVVLLIFCWPAALVYALYMNR